MKAARCRLSLAICERESLRRRASGLAGRAGKEAEGREGCVDAQPGSGTEQRFGVAESLLEQAVGPAAAATLPVPTVLVRRARGPGPCPGLRLSAPRACASRWRQRGLRRWRLRFPGLTPREHVLHARTATMPRWAFRTGRRMPSEGRAVRLPAALRRREAKAGRGSGWRQGGLSGHRAPSKCLVPEGFRRRQGAHPRPIQE